MLLDIALEKIKPINKLKGKKLRTSVFSNWFLSYIYFYAYFYIFKFYNLTYFYLVKKLKYCKKLAR